MSLFINIEGINKTEKYLFHIGIVETKYDNAGELYRALVKEYGRCVGRLYIDDEHDQSQHVGWSFLKRMQYDDCPDTFLAETHIAVYLEEPTFIRVGKFAKLS